MKNRIALWATLGGLLLFGNGMGQQVLKPGPRLEMHNLDDGENASALAYDPVHKLYFGVVAGNEDFPMETWSVKGKWLAGKAAQADLRGLWYNTRLKCLQGNGWESGLIYEIAQDPKGLPKGKPIMIINGTPLPDPQSCGQYDPLTGYFSFLGERSVWKMDPNTGDIVEEIELRAPFDWEGISPWTLIVTGNVDKKFGVMDVNSATLYFFDEKGSYSDEYLLPSDAITYTGFNFSYANKHVWLFDKDTRSWQGYKLW